MVSAQCISITDLRTKTKECLNGAKSEPKYIFINNKPIAVLLNINDYEELITKPTLKELQNTELIKILTKEAIVAKNTEYSDLINIK